MAHNLRSLFYGRIPTTSHNVRYRIKKLTFSHTDVGIGDDEVSPFVN